MVTGQVAKQPVFKKLAYYVNLSPVVCGVRRKGDVLYAIVFGVTVGIIKLP